MTAVETIHLDLIQSTAETLGLGYVISNPAIPCVILDNFRYGFLLGCGFHLGVS